ncbi:MAG: glycosyltransferase, partial [Paracoccaceae bacterium]
GGARRIYGYAGNPPPFGKRRWSGFLYANLARPFTTGDLACSDYVAGLMQRDYRLPEGRVRRFYYPLDVEATRARAAATRAIRAGNGPRIGMVARLDPIKDHRTVIAAFARFRESHPDARLVLAGDGPERGALEALVGSLGLAESVEFLGDRSDVPEQLGLMDVFVYGTTREEGFGIVLAEAMAAGTPIVATDIGPCREVLDDGAAGLLVPARNVEALANGLVRLFGDHDLRAHLAAAAHGVAKERYDLAGAGARFARLLDGGPN